MTVNTLNTEEANALLEKAMKVILSCKTKEQLRNAVKYALLTRKKIRLGRNLLSVELFDGCVDAAVRVSIIRRRNY